MAQAQQAHTRSLFPAVGDIFELSMSKEITGLGMVANFGYIPTNWRFTGATVPVGITKKFKLVAVGYCRNLDEVRRKLAAHGKVPEGVWMQTFDETFGHNGVNPVGVADPSWVHPYGDANFPMVHELGYYRHFDCVARDRGGVWLWLVEVE